MSDFMVKIHNKGDYDYSEKFRGSEIFIKSKGFVKMDYEQANMFMGTMPPFSRRKDGTQDPRSYKKLVMDDDDRRRVEAILRNEAEDKSKKIFVCMACNKEFSSKAALKKHSTEDHAEMMVKEPEE